MDNEERIRRTDEGLRIKFFRAIYKNKLKELRIIQEQRQNEDRIRWLARKFKEARLKRQNQNLEGGGQFMFRKPGETLSEFHHHQQQSQSNHQYSSRDHHEQSTEISHKRKRRSDEDRENHQCSKKRKQGHSK